MFHRFIFHVYTLFYGTGMYMYIVIVLDIPIPNLLPTLFTIIFLFGNQNLIGFLQFTHKAFRDWLIMSWDIMQSSQK
jgi:hypothetical protein